MKVIVIGGGASGIMSAIFLKKKDSSLEITIIEKTNSLGNKLKITGKGRCNVTFEGDCNDFRKNIVKNDKFMFSSFSNFTNNDMISFLKTIGVETKLERGNRYFLKSENANYFVEVLKKQIAKLGIEVIYNSKVEDLIVKDNIIQGVILENYEKIYANKVIIATGGKSYPITGSTGEMYNILNKYGHNIIKTIPGLVPIKTYTNTCEKLQGLTLKNVKITVLDSDRKIYEDFGELLFTHFGVSGPVILSASSVINRIEKLEEKTKNKEIKIIIDLKPALSEETLDLRILRDFEKYNNKEFKNSLNDLLPQKLIPVVIEKTNIDENKKVHQITKEERNKIVNILKEFTLYVNNLHDITFAVITCGGIDVKNVNPKTMESKIISNLYIIGEILDVDAFTGGYNLQIAFSTANAAASSIARSI